MSTSKSYVYLPIAVFRTDIAADALTLLLKVTNEQAPIIGLGGLPESAMPTFAPRLAQVLLGLKIPHGSVNVAFVQCPPDMSAKFMEAVYKLPPKHVAMLEIDISEVPITH